MKTYTHDVLEEPKAAHTPEQKHTIECADSWARIAELPTYSELLAQRDALLDAAKEALPLLKEYIRDAGPCDHSVNICVCGVIAIAEQVHEAIAAVESGKVPE